MADRAVPVGRLKDSAVARSSVIRSSIARSSVAGSPIGIRAGRVLVLSGGVISRRGVPGRLPRRRVLCRGPFGRPVGLPRVPGRWFIGCWFIGDRPIGASIALRPVLAGSSGRGIAISR